MPKKTIVDFGANMAGYGQSGFFGNGSFSASYDSFRARQHEDILAMKEREARQSQIDRILADITLPPAEDAAEANRFFGMDVRVDPALAGSDYTGVYTLGDYVFDANSTTCLNEQTYRELEQRQRDLQAEREAEMARMQEAYRAAHDRAYDEALQRSLQNAEQQTVNQWVSNYDPLNFLAQPTHIPVSPPPVSVKPSVETIERRPRVIELEDAENE